MSDMFPVDITEMIEETRREMDYRRFVYPRLIREKKLNQRTADRRMEVMRQIEQVLVKIREASDRATVIGGENGTPRL